MGPKSKSSFQPWKGYNFEDAIVISEKVVKEDIYTSVHVDEYSLDKEYEKRLRRVNSDIPIVSEEATKDLDENGIIRGAEVKEGDILIGNNSKGESDPTPEENIEAIFGDKADVKVHL